jgi:hypothetical protein
LILLVLGCSRKKDKFLNKKFHSITTTYNYLFNGNNLFSLGLNELDTGEKENFWELIPTEKFKYYDDDFEKERETNFTKAEEKATLAIQKHSMNVEGKEKNPVMDEAYLLLGKSRYFDNRFIPALEAFNYILYKYPTSELINEVKIWKEKVNIRLDQNNYAIDNLKELLEEKNLSREERYLANSYIAQAFVNTNELDSALFYLKKSVFKQKDLLLKTRRKFLLAQVYQELSIQDTAYSIYSDIIDLHRKIPRDFYINSYIKRTMVSDSIDNSITELKLLTENFENNNYLDIIFHQIAMLNLKKGELLDDDKSGFTITDSTAINFFNKSLQSDSEEEFLVAKNYNELAELNFRKKNYLEAGQYYDSTLTQLSNKSREFRKINRKRENLNDLIYYEEISSSLDSIINLIEMPEKKREAYFNNYIEKIKEAQKKEKKKSKNFGSLNTLSTFSETDEGLFYFYNSSAVAYGKSDFKNRWGDRRLADNWRWSITNKDSSDKNISETSKNIDNDSLLSVAYYIGLIPKDTIQIDSLRNLRNDAYFRLGSIYKDQFQEYEISNNRLYDLLENNPKINLIPPAKFFIYKNWMMLDSTEMANKFKDDIINNHSDSKYASILLDPNATINSDQDFKLIYERIYQLYENEKYVEVISKCEENIISFSGEPVVSKLEFLKSLAIARVYGFKEYEKALQFIKLNYSVTLEGKEAERILNEVLPQIKNDEFKENKLSENYKIVYIFVKDENEKISQQLNDLQQYIDEVDFLDLRVSEDFYNNIVTFVVVHGLKSYDGSFGLSERLEKAINIQADSFFVISSDNYKTIQIHKNLEKFRN